MTGKTGERANPKQPVGSLLAALSSRIETRRSASLLLPASIALANLFFCAYFESPIKEDPEARSLSLFLFIEGIFMFALTLAHLAGTTAELLRKSLVMPVEPSARLTFAALSAARNPALQAVVLSDIIFLLIVFHQSAAVVLIVPVLALFMAADIVALTSLLSATAIRRSRPPTLPAAYCILGVLALVAVGLLLHRPAAPGLLPPMSWTAWGITAAAAGKLTLALLYIAASAVFLFLTAFFGRRLA